MTIEDLSAFPGDALGQILQQFFATSFNAILITSAAPGYPILYANPQFCAMTGYSLAELQGQSPKMLQGEKTSQRILTRLKNTIEAGDFFHCSTINYRKNGDPYAVEWNISPVRDAAGKIVYYLSIQKDLTYLKRVIARLKNTNEYFRHFLMDIARQPDAARKLPENSSASDSVLSDAGLNWPGFATRRALAAELIDSAKLYTSEVHAADKVILFDDCMFDGAAAAHSVSDAVAEYEALSAGDYFARYGDNFYTNDVCGNIADIREQIDSLFMTGGSAAELMEISVKLQSVANDIFFLDEFSRLSAVLAELAGSTKTFAQHHVNYHKVPFLLETYQALLDDIEEWIDRVFIAKSAANVHELDASIISSAKQLIVFLA